MSEEKELLEKEQCYQLKLYAMGTILSRIMVNYGALLNDTFSSAYHAIYAAFEQLEGKNILTLSDLGALVILMFKEEQKIKNFFANDEFSSENHRSRVCLLFALTPLRAMISKTRNGIKSRGELIQAPTEEYIKLFMSSLDKIVSIRDNAQRKKSVAELEVALKRKFGLPAEYVK